MMDGFLGLALALLAFIGSHAIAGMPRTRAALVSRLGARTYRLCYSILSLGLLTWVIAAALDAPYLGLWGPWAWADHLLVALMAPVCILLMAGVLEPNPFSLSFGPGLFHPGRPGVVGLIRHPLPVGFALWAGAHLLANGDLAGLALFGSMLLLSLAGPAIAGRKARRVHGADRLERWSREMAAAPWRHRLPGLRSWFWGLMLYLVLIQLHGPVIGIDPRAMI